VLQSFDRGELGVSQGSEPRAPAFLTFVADLHTRECAASTRSLGYPSTLRSVAAVIEPLRNLPRSYGKLAPPASRACRPAADPDNWVGAFCSLLQRCEPPGDGVRSLQDRVPTSARFDSCSEVSSDSALRPLWVRPSPFDVYRFRLRPSGLRAASSCQWVSRHQQSSRQVVRLLEATSLVNCTRMARSRCASHAVLSPTTLDRNRRPYFPAGSNRRHRPSTGFLTLSTSCFACNHGGLVSSHLRPWG
jgi:hypothetical protein